ncbi:MAG: amino acid ABC transporter substrate-binding protein [Pseudomonadota bacterium]
MRKLIWAVAIALLASGPSLADVLSNIKDRGSIRLGIRADAPPFSYLDEETEPAGLAVKLCHEVTKRLAIELGLEGLEIEHKIVNAKTRFPALQEGLTDLHCGPATATLSRRQFLDFSILYFVDGAGIATRKGAYEKVFDTRKGTLGVVAGTTTEALVNQLISDEKLDAELVTFASHNRGLKALAEEKIDLYFGDRSIVLFQIGAHGLFDKIVVRNEVLSFEPYALAMRAGERNMQLAVDRALSEIYGEGLIFEIIDQELGTYPLSDAGRAIYEIVGLPN